MVRTQIQLTKEQASSLKKIAAKKNLSIAKLIRQAVDHLLHSHIEISSKERQRRAMAAAGCFHFGKRDVSEKHDIYLAEVYKK